MTSKLLVTRVSSEFVTGNFCVLQAFFWKLWRELRKTVTSTSPPLKCQNPFFRVLKGVEFTLKFYHGNFLSFTRTFFKNETGSKLPRGIENYREKKHPPLILLQLHLAKSQLNTRISNKQHRWTLFCWVSVVLPDLLEKKCFILGEKPYSGVFLIWEYLSSKNSKERDGRNHV